MLSNKIKLKILKESLKNFNNKKKKLQITRIMKKQNIFFMGKEIM